MGIFFLFAIIILLYFFIKIAMLITANILAIYIIVKKSKRKKVGKIIILPIIILSVLQVISAPGDLLTIDATTQSVKYRKELKTSNYAFTEHDDSVDFVYNNVKYVNLKKHLTNVKCDGTTLTYSDESKHFKPLSKLVVEENIKSGIQFLFFNPEDYTLYVCKNSPDEKILFTDFDGEIFCREEELDNAIATYNNPENYDYYIEYWVDGVKNEQKISSSVFQQVLKCETKCENDEYSYFNETLETYNTAELYAISHDERVCLENISYNLVVSNKKLYYVYNHAIDDARYLNIKLN